MPKSLVRTSRLRPLFRKCSFGDNKGTIRLWDVATARTKGEAKWYASSVTGLGFLNDNVTLLSAGREGVIHAWNIEQQKEVGRVSMPCGDFVESMAMCPAQNIVVCGGYRGVVRIMAVKRILAGTK